MEEWKKTNRDVYEYIYNNVDFSVAMRALYFSFFCALLFLFGLACQSQSGRNRVKVAREQSITISLSFNFIPF